MDTASEFKLLRWHRWHCWRARNYPVLLLLRSQRLADNQQARELSPRGALQRRRLECQKAERRRTTTKEFLQRDRALG